MMWKTTCILYCVLKACAGISLPESQLHRNIRKEILPDVGSKLKDENLVISHGLNSILRWATFLIQLTQIMSFTLPTLKDVPLEILNSIGNKTIWGNVMVPYVLLKCCEVSHFIFILTGYAAGDASRFFKQMSVAMAMLHGLVYINKKMGIVKITDLNVEKIYNDLKETLVLWK
jgi:hypothetical protein